MLTINVLQDSVVPEHVRAFADQFCTNHVTMLKAWEIRPEMKDDYANLFYQLAHVVQGKRTKAVIMRLLGRISVVRRTVENDEFEKLWG